MRHRDIISTSCAMKTTKIRRAHRFLLIVLLVCGILVASIHWYHVECHSFWCRNIQHFMHSPIDHLRANWLKPLYNLQVGLTR